MANEIIPILCYLLLCTLTGGHSQPNFFNITTTQAIVSTPSTVQLMCVGTSNPDIQSVVWYDSHGDTLNSTSMLRDTDHENVVPTVRIVATLDVERVVCVNAVYRCVFENEVTSFFADVECPSIPEVTFESSSYTAGEGDGLLHVCLSVRNTTNGTIVTISETDSTASRRTDFSLARAFNLTITPDQLVLASSDDSCHYLCGRQCFSIPITQDLVFEYQLESFSLELRVRDVLAPLTSNTTVYIQDDDELVIGFERAVYTFSEGGGVCTPQVRLCAQVTGSILGLPLEVVPVWRAGTAVEGVDYQPPPCNFTFSPGGSIDCMDLDLINDDVAELTETLSVIVGDVFVDGRRVDVGGRVRTDVRETLIQITDNDVFEVSFEETEYTIHEAGPGESHTALRVCLVQREGGALSADMGEDGDSLMVDITISTLDGTATGGHDYVSVNSTLSVRLPLSESVCECVVVRNDQVVEATETFTMQLATSHPFVNTGGRVATVMLRDNSPSAVSVGFEHSQYSVREEDVSLEVCVTVVGEYQRSIHALLCSESGNATGNVDFVEILNQRLSFSANPLSPPLSDGRICLNVTVLPDTLLEADEVFTLSLQSSDTAVHLTPSTTTIVILNDQGTLPTLTFTNNTPSVVDNEVHADFILTQREQLSSVTCSLSGPGRTPTITLDCSSGHVTYTDLPIRRQQFTLTVNAHLLSDPRLHPLNLATVTLRLDHSVCWLHPINGGVVIVGENRVTFEWQATGPSSSERVIAFLCRRDRDQTERPCNSPYIWQNPSPGNHLLFVTPVFTTGCRRHITREFNFTYTG
ncbi:uncharacterized protein LOC135333885 isoform X2 [Halichondria panicea]